MESLYARPPASLAACQQATDEILRKPRDWKQLAKILRESGEHYGVPEQTLAQLELLAMGKAVAVVTGQQVGYLGGPLFTLLKAYHTTRLAAQIENWLNLPVLPIFWLEGEDHDLDEIRTANFLNQTGEILPLQFTPENMIPNFEVGRYSVNAASDLESLSVQYGQPNDDAMQLLSASYANGTLSDAMGKLLAEILGPRGLLIVEGMEGALKKLASPLWEKVIDRGYKLEDIFRSRSETVRSNGWPAPMSPTPDAYFFYHSGEDHVRHPVTFKGKIKLPDGSERDWQYDPLCISPKAALRPLYQDFVLPTVAYVGGPGELEYHAQLAPLYAELDVIPPSLFPRLSATIMDNKIPRYLEKLKLTVEHILVSDPALLSKEVLHGADENHTSKLFSQSRNKIESAYQNLKDTLAEIDPTLVGALETSIGKSLHPIEQLQQKTEKALKQKHAILLHKLAHVQTALRPNNKPAERVFSTAHYLLKFGADNLLKALDEIPADGKEHQIVTMES